MSTRRKTQSSARYGIFVYARYAPEQRFRSRVFPKVYRSKTRAEKVVGDAQRVSPCIGGLYIVKALRGREK